MQFRQLRTLRRDTVHSFSVYRRKKVQKEASQPTDTDSPSATPEAEFAKVLSAKITQQEQDVKQKSATTRKSILRRVAQEPYSLRKR